MMNECNILGSVSVSNVRSQITRYFLLLKPKQIRLVPSSDAGILRISFCNVRLMGTVIEVTGIGKIATNTSSYGPDVNHIAQRDFKLDVKQKVETRKRICEKHFLLPPTKAVIFM